MEEGGSEGELYIYRLTVNGGTTKFMPGFKISNWVTNSNQPSVF